MFHIIAIMFAGVLAGYLLRKSKALSHTGKAVSITIYIMLFALGVEIGTNKEIIGNIPKIGLQALVFSIAGITGSVAASVLIFKYFFKERKA